MIDGYNNTASNVNHAYVIGANNTIQGKKFSDATKDGVLSKADRDKAKKDDNLIVIGDNHTLANDVSNNIILGTADKTLTTNASNVVMIGHNADAKVDGGVAIGSGSIANVEKGQKGYYVKHDQRSEEGQGYPFQKNDSAWISRAGAVSVGDTTNKDQSKWITRQITGVAAGTNDTDAVNVAQLKNSQTKYFSIYDPGDNWLGIFPQIPDWAEKYKNENNQGATNYWGMAAGFGTSTDGLASTVIGSLSRTNSLDGMQGATSVSVGTFNFNLSDPTVNDAINADNPDVHAQTDWGVANSIVGQVNLAKNSNGALIYGAGNVVTNSYRNVDGDGGASGINGLLYGDGDMQSLLSDPEKAIKVVGKLIDSSGGKAMVFGGGNVLDKAYSTQVVGVGNTVTGSDLNFTYQESPEIGKITNWVERDAARTADIWNQYEASLRNNGTRLNYVDGYYSTLKNGQNDYMIGTANEVTGDDASKNKSNIVFGDYHKLKNGQNNIIIGSADGSVEEKATPFVDTDEYGKHITTEITGQKQHVENLTDAVIIGHNADVQKNGGVAIGAGSVASVDKASVDENAIGYDPVTKKASTDTSSTWKSTAAAVSVGDASKNITRQITNVAAGTKATDAVNVAQLQQALSGAKDGNDTLKSDTNALTLNGNTLSMNVEDTAGHKVSGSVDLSKFAQAVDTNTTYTLSGQANQDNTTTITLKDSNGREDSVTVATKDTDTRNTVKAGENVTLDTKDNADGSHEYTVKVKADGKVEAGSTKIVSGGTVYNETRVAKDGNFVKQSNTAGENLSALDSQVASNASGITNLNGRVSNLDSKINKVGAGAAALAALHPLDFDPDDKWDFAVGYGNYRDANSAAVGAFYRPDEDTMFSLGTNFGNGENMINAGVSFKFGPKGKSQVRPGSTQEITELRATVARQDDQLKKQDSEIKELKAMVQQLLAAQDKKAATK